MNDLKELVECWENSPFPSAKISSYFSAYSELFAQYRNTECIFIETGILGGGSLFMWRNWLGPKARIIGIDLNPEAVKWREYGFEIYIGDQGDPEFWRGFYKKIGDFNIFLDDGGHQSFQQIVTVQQAIAHAKNKCLVVVEDTHCSFMNDFNSHGVNSFLNYAKDSTDVLTAKSEIMYPNRMPKVQNPEILALYKWIHSIQFFNSMVAFKVDPSNVSIPNLIWNKRDSTPSDFRYHGLNSAEIIWPNPFINKSCFIVEGKKN